MHGNAISLLIEGEHTQKKIIHICIAAPLHILVVSSQKLWKGCVALKRTHNSISKSKIATGCTVNTIHREKDIQILTRGTNDINFLLPWVNIEKYLPLCFPPCSNFQPKMKNWPLIYYYCRIFYLFLLSFFLCSLFFADFRILFFLFLIFLCTIPFFHRTLFECLICSLAVALSPHCCRFFFLSLFRMFKTKGIFFAWLAFIPNINAKHSSSSLRIDLASAISIQNGKKWRDNISLKPIWIKYCQKYCICMNAQRFFYRLRCRRHWHRLNFSILLNGPYKMRAMPHKMRTGVTTINRTQHSTAHVSVFHI